MGNGFLLAFSDMIKAFMRLAVFAAAFVCVNVDRPLLAFELGEKLSVSGVLAGAGQCLVMTQGVGAGDDCRTAVPFQPEVSLRPNEAIELFAKFGFAAGNGLDTISPFVLAPWAADLEFSVKNINGRSRDHLLTAWYQHTFDLGDERSLVAVGGIIDSTDYTDQNAYANDEYNQFMNEVFVNATTSFKPSYDYGGAAVLELGDWALSAVAMRVGENDDGNSFTFFSGQIARKIKTEFGSGTYRVGMDISDEAFLNSAGTDSKRLFALIFSADQELGEGLGAFARIGWQNDARAVDYDLLLSGGLNISGTMWGRQDDNIGMGFAYLSGGNTGISSSRVIEAYYRFVVAKQFAITADVQYMADDLRANRGSQGFVLSLRSTAEF